MGLSGDEVERFRECFARVESERLDVVRYVNLDYRREGRAAWDSGPRMITDEDEWAEPTWKFGSIDSVDWGIELVTDAGSMLSISWCPPSMDLESLRPSNRPLLEDRLAPNTDVAVWEVSSRPSRWWSLLGQAIGAAVLPFEQWGKQAEAGRWLPHLVLPIGEHRVDVALGEASLDDESVQPHATNLAIAIDSPSRAALFV
jgi:hypothetical protein